MKGKFYIEGGVDEYGNYDNNLYSLELSSLKVS